MEVKARVDDWSSTTYDGKALDFAAVRARGPVVVVLLRGFMCPNCRRQLSILKDMYPQIRAQGAEVVVIGPDPAPAFERYFRQHELPFLGVPDREGSLRRALGQQRRLIGWMPAQIVVHSDGTVAAVHYGRGQSDLPDAKEMLALLEGMAQAV